MIQSVGDDHNALILLTVKVSFGPSAPLMTLTAARLYLLDENNKIKVEQVVFYTSPQ